MHTCAAITNELLTFFEAIFTNILVHLAIHSGAVMGNCQRTAYISNDFILRCATAPLLPAFRFIPGATTNVSLCKLSVVVYLSRRHTPHKHTHTLPLNNNNKNNSNSIRLCLYYYFIAFRFIMAQALTNWWLARCLRYPVTLKFLLINEFKWSPL